MQKSSKKFSTPLQCVFKRRERLESLLRVLKKFKQFGIPNEKFTMLQLTQKIEDIEKALARNQRRISLYIRSPRALGDLKKAKKLGFSISLFKRFSTLLPLAKEDSSFVPMGSYRFL